MGRGEGWEEEYGRYDLEKYVEVGRDWKVPSKCHIYGRRKDPSKQVERKYDRIRDMEDIPQNRIYCNIHKKE